MVVSHLIFFIVDYDDYYDFHNLFNKVMIFIISINKLISRE
jgi:hypothetical protein